MVTGVLSDSTNQPTKKPRQKRSQTEQSENRPTTSRQLFAPQLQTFQPSNMLSLAKALTSTLLVFDGESEKHELFEDLFRKKSKCIQISRKYNKSTNLTHSQEATHSKRVALYKTLTKTAWRK